MTDRDDRVAALIATRRGGHVLKGHTRTNTAGYCAESDGVSATWCDDGLYLEALDRALTQPQTAIERAARDHFEPRRHFYEGDGKQDCLECGEGCYQDFLRIRIHYDDGDG